CQLLFFTILADCYLYTLSLHDALPILDWAFNLYYWISLFFFVLVVGLIVLFLLKYKRRHEDQKATGQMIHNTLLETSWTVIPLLDRKSTRLNSSHVKISYAVFCLKKKT